MEPFSPMTKGLRAKAWRRGCEDSSAAYEPGYEEPM
jgi:hypothetical protein